MILAFTGHRPDHLGGYHPLLTLKLTRLAIDILKEEKPDEVMSGMALGWDMAVANAAMVCKLPLIAAVPFFGQEVKWREDYQIEYFRLLAYAKAFGHVVYTSSGGYTVNKMHVRNYWMVDNSNKLCALWDGVPKGGTFSTVSYAQRKGRLWFNVWDRWAMIQPSVNAN